MITGKSHLYRVLFKEDTIIMNEHEQNTIIRGKTQKLSPITRQNKSVLNHPANASSTHSAEIKQNQNERRKTKT